MDHNDQLIDKIERYLNGEMDRSEKETFEAALQNDKSLAESVTLHQETMHGINQFFAHQLKQSLQKAEKDLADQPDDQRLGGRGKKMYWWMGLAASLLVGIVLIFLFNQKPVHQEIFATYYRPYLNLVSPLERSGESAEEFNQDPFKLYESGDFEQAIDLFEKLKNEGTVGNEHLFYLGLSYLETDQVDEAVENLLLVAQRNEGFLANPSQWYLALAYVKAEQLQAAQEAFEELAGYSNEYQDQAKEILERLR
ncbi:MAG: tetratricopeptide repeat protein [Candidatus Cyclobacteriaceae bacterium M3_2C_046]